MTDTITGTSNCIGELPKLVSVDRCAFHGDDGFRSALVVTFSWQGEEFHYLARRVWREIVRPMVTPIGIAVPTKGRKICGVGVTIYEGYPGLRYNFSSTGGSRKAGWRFIGFNRELSVDRNFLREETARYDAIRRYIPDSEKMPRPPMGQII